MSCEIYKNPSVARFWQKGGEGALKLLLPAIFAFIMAMFAVATPANAQENDVLDNDPAVLHQQIWLGANSLNGGFAEQQKTYTVVYNLNKGNGSTDPHISRTFDVVALGHYSEVTPPTPTRDGYVFKGWRTAKRGSSADLEPGKPFYKDLSTNPKADGSTKVTIYAVWEAVGYSVNYDVNKGDGSTEPSISKTSDRRVFDSYTPTTTPTPTRAGYDFLGWSNNAGGEVVWKANDVLNGNLIESPSEDGTSSLTLYAVWKAKTYSIEYNVNKGSGSTNVDAVRGAEVTFDNPGAVTPPTLKREGYDFKGWSTKSAGPVEWAPGELFSDNLLLDPQGKWDTVYLYAIWEAHTGTVNYWKNDGTSTKVTNTWKFDASYSVKSASTFARDNYTFDGWATSPEGNATVEWDAGSTLKQFNKIASGEINLYAKWKPSGGDKGDGDKGDGDKGDGDKGDGDKGDGDKGDEADEPVTYTVKYDTNVVSGSTWASYVKPSDKVTVGKESEIKLPDTYRRGYTFKGWSTSKTGSAMWAAGATLPAKLIANPAKDGSSSVTLYGIWEAQSINIEYQTSGATSSDAKNTTLKFDTTFKLPSAPTKKGYTFLGWVSSMDGIVHKSGETISLNFETVGSNTKLTYTAQWKENSYKVKYDLNGGSGAVPNTQTVSYSSNVMMPTSVGISKKDSILTGWLYNGKTYLPGTMYSMLSEGNEAGTVTITMKAVWSADKYTVTYDANGGTVSPASQTYYVLGGLSSLPTPTKTGYTFEGWYVGNTKYTSIPVGTVGNITLTARWSGAKYTVNYNTNKGNGTSIPSISKTSDAVAFDNEQAVTPPSPTRAGYTFKGWATSANGAVKWQAGKAFSSHVMDNPSSDGKSTVTIYAVWAANSVAVKYDTAGGTAVSGAESSKAFDATLKLPDAPTKAGYTFSGWKLSHNNLIFNAGASLVMNNTNVGTDNSVTLTAQWIENTYVIRYNLNGGSGITPGAQTAKYSANVTLARGLGFAKDGYTFAGWSYGGKTYAAGSVTSKLSLGNASGTAEVTLLAVWKANPCTVTYNANGGSVTPTSQSFTPGVGLSSLPEPTRNGYKFEGWYVDNTKYTNIPATVKSNITLTAKWSIETYTVQYNLNSGSMSGQKTSYTVNDTFTLPTPTRTGYTFTGWTGSNGTTAQTNVTIAKGTTGNKTYTANWKLNTYAVKYNLNSGSLSGQKTSYTVDDTFTLPTPTRTGYTFTGWTGTGLSSATKSVTVAKGSTGDRTYTANWQVTSYTVTYNLNGGSISGQKTSYTVDDTFTLPTPTKSGYIFTGWTGSNGSTAQTSVSVAKGSTGNKTYTANWKEPTAPTVTVQGLNNPNGRVSVDGYSVGTMTGYESHLQQQSNKLNYKWNPNKTLPELLAYDNGDTKYVTGIQIYMNGSLATTVTYNGLYDYVFVAGNSYELRATLGTGKYNVIMQARTKDSLGNAIEGVNTKNGKATYVESIDLGIHWYHSNGTYNATRSGYVRMAWYANGKERTSGGTHWNGYSMVAYAVWGNTVTYNANGGSVSPSSQNYKVGDSISSLPTPTRAGYTFNGWYNGSKKYTSIPAGTGNITLTANWTAITKGNYWLNTKNASNPESGILKGQSQIDSDIAAIKAGNQTVINEYTNYMNNDNVHLYTTWRGSGATGANKWVECRIIQVGSHKNGLGESDGTGLTFMTTHSLAFGGKAMTNGYNKNNYGGWLNSDMYKDGFTWSNNYSTGKVDYGWVWAGLADVRDKVKSVQRTTYTGSQGNWTVKSNGEKFSLLSASEIEGVKSGTCYNEGEQYQLFKNKGIGWGNAGDRTVLQNLGLKRSGEKTNNNSYWWTRTAGMNSSGFLHVGQSGGVTGASYVVAYEWGVVPTFAM